MRITTFVMILSCPFVLGCASQSSTADSTLFEEFGGHQAIEEVVELTIRRSHRDPRIAFHFDNTDDASFGQILATQLCELAKGPCQYEGLSMVEAHLGMAVTRADFDVFVQILIDSMEEVGIPFAAQNRMLALLAPMRGEIIDK